MEGSATLTIEVSSMTTNARPARSRQRRGDVRGSQVRAPLLRRPSRRGVRSGVGWRRSWHSPGVGGLFAVLITVSSSRTGSHRRDRRVCRIPACQAVRPRPIRLNAVAVPGRAGRCRAPLCSENRQRHDSPAADSRLAGRQRAVSASPCGDATNRPRCSHTGGNPGSPSAPTRCRKTGSKPNPCAWVSGAGFGAVPTTSYPIPAISPARATTARGDARGYHRHPLSRRPPEGERNVHRAPPPAVYTEGRPPFTAPRPPGGRPDAVRRP